MSTADPYFKLRSPPPTPEDEICDCEGTRPIKLMQALSSNPLHCIDCNLEVAPESLAISGSLVEEIAAWRSVYSAMELLWLDSGAYEKWASREMSDLKSPVNQRGLALREKLEAIRRCYYSYHQDETAEGFEPLTHCPACAQPLSEYADGIHPQLICESCSIVLFA